MSKEMDSHASKGQISNLLTKFSATGKEIVILAQEEARAFRHNYLGTEHLLLGLLRSSESQAAAVLMNTGITLETARLAVERIIGYGPAPVEGEPKPVPRAISVLSLAASEAFRLKQFQVGPEHILLGLLREDQGVAIGILANFESDADKMRVQLLQSIALTGVAVPADPTPAKSNVVACRVDKRDLDAIDALIEAGIRSTRSDAAAWLIHAGIEANKTLFEKVNSTVAEIRRLRASMQQLVQEGEIKPEAEEEQDADNHDDNPGSEQAS